MSFEQNPETTSSKETGLREGSEQAEQTKATAETSVQIPDDPERMAAYQQTNQMVDERIATTERELEDLSGQIAEANKKLGIETGDGHEISSLSRLRDELQGLSLEKVKVSANYPGDWTMLLRERMLDRTTKEKFIRTREAAATEMKAGEPGPLDKPSHFAQHYHEQISTYDDRVSHVFNSTEIGTADEYGKRPKHLGMGRIGEPGVVFTDAGYGEEVLNPRQKNIIEAHEKGHGLRDFTSPVDKKDFAASLDTSVLRQEEDRLKAANPDVRFANYLSSAEEVAERMAQLKNYFGFKAGDTFTKDHLHYAREHYVTDTNLDNNMTPFFNAITPETEAAFLETINTYPL